MANLTNMRKRGADLDFSLSITDSQRKFIPNTQPQTCSISVQEILPTGLPGLFWDFVAPYGFTIGPGEPALFSVPETLIVASNTGKYETTLIGAGAVVGSRPVSVHILNTGKDKTDMYYIDYIDNSELIQECCDVIVASVVNILGGITKLRKDAEGNKLDLRLLIASTERMKKGRL